MRCLGDQCSENGGTWIPGPSRLCSTCLDTSRHDVKALVRDYADLENVMADLGGRLERVSGTQEPGVNIALGAEALQRDIWHTVTTWEEIIRDHSGLNDVYPGRTRDGWAVQRAVRILSPRLDVLSAMGPTAIFPRGIEHGPEDVTGIEAIQTMRRLHRRVGWAIGLRHLKHQLPGPCDNCGIEGGLRRDDGTEDVYCALCQSQSTWDDYRRQTTQLVQAHRRK